MKGTGAAEVTTNTGESLSLVFAWMDPYSFYQGSKGDSSLVFSDDQGNSLALGGLLTKGTQRTSTDLALSLVAQDVAGKPLSLTSGDGSCSVTITQASSDAIAGTFRCPKVKVSRNVIVDAVGSFSGAPPAGS